MLILIATLLFSFSAIAQDARVEARKLIGLAVRSANPSISDASLIQMGKSIQNYLHNPKNKSVLKTVEGKALARIQFKLANYMVVKKKLAACVKDKSSRLHLSERITGAILMDKDGCEDSLSALSYSQMKDFAEVMTNLEKTYKPKDTQDLKKLAEFRDDALEKGYDDALHTYLDLQYRNSPEGTKIDVEKAFNHLFELDGVGVPGHTTPSRFDSGVKYGVIEKGEKYLAHLKKSIKPQSAKQTRLAFNKRIAEMKKALGSIPNRPVNPAGRFQDGAGYGEYEYNKYKNKGGAHAWVRDENKKYYNALAIRNTKMTEYNIWAADHLKDTLESPNGTLMFTKSIAQYFVPPVNLTDDVELKIKAIPNDKVITDGVAEAKNETKKFGQYLAKMNYYKTVFGAKLDKGTVKEQIKSLTRSAPATIADSLIKNPEAIGMVCEAINTADADQKSDEKKEEIYMYGGLIVGGALLVTGVGSAVGATMLAGTATGTLLATVATGSAVLGTTASIAEIGYLNHRSNKLQRQNSELTSALFSSRMNDSTGWAETKKLAQELEDTNFSLSLSAGFLVLDLGTWGLAFKSLSKADQLKKLTNMEKLLKNINKDPAAVENLKKMATTLGEKEAAQLLTELADQDLTIAQVKKILQNPEATHLPATERKIAQVSPSQISHAESTKLKLSPSQMSYSKLKPLSSRPVDALEMDLKNAKFIKVENIGDGRNLNTQTRLVHLDKNQKAIWKPHTEHWGSNYRAEVLAYEIDKKLGFNLVPVTVEKEVNGVKGSLQLFKDSAPRLKPKDMDLNKQKLLDFIINQRDRAGGNYLVGKDRSLISIDNGMSFTDHATKYTGDFYYNQDAIKVFLLTPDGKQIMSKVKRLNLTTLSKEIKAYVGEKDGEQVIIRLEKLIEFEKTIHP